jgi:hypothetical protein
VFQKLFIFAFVAAGLFLIGKGISEWNKQGEVRVTVDQFAEALIAGDRDLFLSTLDEDLKLHFLKNEDKKEKFVPLPNAIYRVKFIEFDKLSENDQVATSQILINGEGFVIKPSMTLRKVSDSVWKIVEIDPDKNKPIWSDYEKEIDNLSDNERKELEKQIKKKLKNKKPDDTKQAQSKETAATQ